MKCRNDFKSLSVSSIVVKILTQLNKIQPNKIKKDISKQTLALIWMYLKARGKQDDENKVKFQLKVMADQM